MRVSPIIPAAVLILLSLAVADDEDPVQEAKDNAKEAADSMKEAAAGVTADGDKVSKAEARDWFDYKKHTDHRTFKLSAKFAREIIEGSYKAGAEKVWVVGITREELAGAKFDLADNMVIVLPKDPAKRKAVFAVWNKHLTEAEEPTLKDIGQAYIYAAGDPG